MTDLLPAAVPLEIAIWLAVAEINSLWIESVRLKSDPECTVCHHCPVCCNACAALDWLKRHLDLDAAIAQHVGRFFPWQDTAGKITWKAITAPWRSGCQET